jgi:hypothetical protein
MLYDSQKRTVKTLESGMLARYQPDLPIRKAHDIRRIQPCKCGGIGMRDNMVKIGKDWWHGRCAIAEHGIDYVASLPRAATAGLVWSEIGTDAMKRLVNR